MPLTRSRASSHFSMLRFGSSTHVRRRPSNTRAMPSTPPRSRSPTNLGGSSVGWESTAERSWGSSARTLPSISHLRYLRPGFAFGGSCLPKDLRSLLYLARSESIDIPLLSGTLASNRFSIDEAIDRVVAGEGSRIALLGLSFKPGSDDLRESPYVDLAETLLGKGYEVRIHDPIVNPTSLVGANKQYVESKLPHLKRILTDSPREAIAGADVAIVSSFDRGSHRGVARSSAIADHRPRWPARVRNRGSGELRRVSPGD